MKVLILEKILALFLFERAASQGFGGLLWPTIQNSGFSSSDFNRNQAQPNNENRNIPHVSQNQVRVPYDQSDHFRHTGYIPPFGFNYPIYQPFPSVQQAYTTPHTQEHVRAPEPSQRPSFGTSPAESETTESSIQYKQTEAPAETTTYATSSSTTTTDVDNRRISEKSEYN